MGLSLPICEVGKELGQPSSAHLDLSAGTWVEFQQKAALRLRGAGAEQGQGAAEAGEAAMLQEWQAVQASQRQNT